MLCDYSHHNGILNWQKTVDAGVIGENWRHIAMSYDGRKMFAVAEVGRCWMFTESGGCSRILWWRR